MGSGQGSGRGDAFGELLLVAGEGAEVALHLEAVPEVLGLAEEDAKTDRQYARYVYLIVRGDSLADSLSQYLLERIEKSEQITVKYHSEVTGLGGGDALEEIELSNSENGETETIETKRLFVCIGGAPNTEWAKGTDIVRDKLGYLVCGPDLLGGGEYPDCWRLDRRPHFFG